jgi:hypothetical protein
MPEEAPCRFDSSKNVHRGLQEEHFVDASIAAQFLSCSRKHVLKLSVLGRIPAHPLPGSAKRRTWRYLVSELQRWMLNNCTLTKNGPNPQDGRTIGGGGSRKGGQ